MHLRRRSEATTAETAYRISGRTYLLQTRVDNECEGTRVNRVGPLVLPMTEPTIGERDPTSLDLLRQLEAFVRDLLDIQTSP